MWSTVVKSVLLLILIGLLLFGGMLIFDWLGLISVRRTLAPALELVGLNAPTQEVGPVSGVELNEIRLRQQLESLELQRKNLDELEKDLVLRADQLDERELEIKQTEELITEQQSALEQESSLYQDRQAKISQITMNFNGMPPEQAVAQMNEMEDLLVVDVLRSAEKIAVENNTTSLVSFWISLMPPIRAAGINELLVEKP